MSFQAGWYPDPMERFEHRYYDGTTWTEHVASGGVQAVDPLGSSTSAGTTPAAASANTSESTDTASDVAPSGVVDSAVDAGSPDDAGSPGDGAVGAAAAAPAEGTAFPADRPLTTTTAISAAQAAAELAELQASDPGSTALAGRGAPPPRTGVAAPAPTPEPEPAPVDSAPVDPAPVDPAPVDTAPVDTPAPEVPDAKPEPVIAPTAEIPSVESEPVTAPTDGSSTETPAAETPPTEAEPPAAVPQADPAPAPATTSPPAEPAAAAPAKPTGGLVLPDDPEGAPKRKLWGIVMISAAGAVVFSLLLPWVSGSPEAATSDGPNTVMGFQWMFAWIAAAIAVGMGFYGLQGVQRSRVRFHVLALFGILFLVSATFSGTLDPDESARKQLGVTQREQVTRVNVTPSGVTTTTTSGESPVETEPGLWIAILAGLVMIAPLVVLWRDDRRRRAELLQAGAVAAGSAPLASTPTAAAPAPFATTQAAPPEPATAADPLAPPDPATLLSAPAAQQAAAPEPAAPTVAADWYPDPSKRFELRYFDGSAWTEHVSRSGVQAVDPAGGLDDPPPSPA